MAGSVASWLQELGLEAYTEVFERHDIDIDVAADLTDDDLRELGVGSLGHRKRLLRAITALKSSGASRSNDRPTVADSLRADSALHSRELVDHSSVQADRRQLTVMFCDLVDSTALSTRIDPEDYRETIRAYQDACAEVIVRCGGFVARYMGDGILAYFGWPRSHEDDAERAINAGLGIAETVRRIAPPAGEQLPPAVRVGIATGPVIVGDIIGEGASREAAVTGVTPNLAARLQQLAGPDAVVVAGSTYNLVRGLFSYEALGPQRLKGIEEVVDAWRVVGRTSTRTRFEAVRGKTLTPLVGRDHEFALLQQRWDMARDGEGSVVLLSGEAGIGKSRLTQALIDHIRELPHVEVGFQCAPYEASSAFGTIVHELERSAGFLPRDTIEARLAKLERLIRIDGEGDEESIALIAGLLMLPIEGRYQKPVLSPQQLKQRTLDALCVRLFALAKRGPLLVVWEDAHWLDPSSQELLEAIAARVGAAPVLVLVTHRPDWTATFAHQTHVSVLQLGRLGRRNTAELIRHIASGEVPSDTVDRILERADGVPLFVEEMTRSVLASGSGPDAGNQIPDSLHASLTARLDRLPPPARDLAQMASAIGREVSVPLLAAVAGGGRPDGIGDSLEDLLRSQLVLNGGTSDDPQIVFRHALIRDAAYQSLLKSRRQEIHRRIATAIEQSFPQTAESQPELVARHYAEAGEPLLALARWQEAAQRATAASASREAVNHYRNALAQLALTPRGLDHDRKELQLTLAMGVPLIASTGYASPEVRQNYSRARELGEGIGDAEGLFIATRGLWNCVFDQAELDDALDLANALVGFAGSDPAKQALAQRALGSTHVSRASFDDAVAAFDRCLASHAEIDPFSVVGDDVEAPNIVALQYKGFVRCLQGRCLEGRALLDRAVAEARVLRHALGLTFSLHLRAVSQLLIREYEGSLASASEARSLADEHGLVFWIAGSKLIQGCASAHLDGSVASLELGRKGLEEWRGTAAKLYVPSWLLVIADAALAVGEYDIASLSVADALAIVETGTDVVSLSDLKRIQGDLAVRRGERDVARGLLEGAIMIAEQQGAYLSGIRSANSLAGLLVEAGRPHEARTVLERMLAHFDAKEVFADLAEGRALLAAIAQRGPEGPGQPV